MNAGKKIKPSYENLGMPDYLSGLVNPSSSPAATVQLLDVSDSEDLGAVADAPIPGVIVPKEQRVGYIVNLDLIKPYDKNQRSIQNRRYEEIRDSILVDGLKNSLVITKRPSDPWFMVAEGGNTRLTALNEIVARYDVLASQQKALAITTPGAKSPLSREEFLRQNVTFKPWPGELAVADAHDKENGLRDDYIWWDEACVKMDLKRLHEERAGVDYSLTQFAALLKANGSKRCSKDLLARYQFAVDKLQPIAELDPLAIAGERVIVARSAYLDCQTVWLTQNPGKDDIAFADVIHGWTREFAEANAGRKPDGNPQLVDQLVEFWLSKAGQLIEGVEPETVWSNHERIKSEGPFVPGNAHADPSVLAVAVPQAPANDAAPALPPSKAPAAKSSPASKKKGQAGVDGPTDLRTQAANALALDRTGLNDDVIEMIDAVINEERHPLMDLIERARNPGPGQPAAQAFFRYVASLVQVDPAP